MIRAGQSAAVAASRAREREAAAAEARGELAAYWARRVPGLPERLTCRAYVQRAEADARALMARRERTKNLEERKNKLLLMMHYENMEIQEQLKIASAQAKLCRKSTYLHAVPTSTLREVNLGIKAKEDERRRQEAEIKLYHRWRADRPVLREIESARQHRELKCAWMDQIIEKDDSKKREEENLKKILEDRDKYLKRQEQRENEDKVLRENKKKELNDQLCQQIEDLRASEATVAGLRRQEEAERELLRVILVAEVARGGAAQRRAAQGTALGNMALHARRLRERARRASADLEADLQELQTIMDTVYQDAEMKATVKQEWRVMLESARESMEKQRNVEAMRQRMLQDAMDGEARALYQKQEKIWQQEHTSRQSLLNEVLSTLKMQVKAKLEENQEQQRQNIHYREKMLIDIEEATKQLEENEKTKTHLKDNINMMNSMQIKTKEMEKEERQNVERMETENTFREAALEEERLRNEIIRLQRENCGFQIHRRRKAVW